MIKNLIKYDLKRMLRFLVYFYAIAIGLATIARIILIGKNIQFIYILGQVFLSLCISAIIAIVVNTFVHIIRAFIFNFYKDESYLTHTLPVTKTQLLISKMLSALIVILSSVIVCVLSVLILFYSTSLKITLIAVFENVVSGFNMSALGFICLIALVVFSQICANLCMSFSAIVKGNSYNSKRISKGLVWFAIYYLGALFVTLLLVISVFTILGKLPELFATKMMQSSFILILIIATIAYFGIAISQFFLCKKLFNKGVNID